MKVNTGRVTEKKRDASKGLWHFEDPDDWYSRPICTKHDNFCTGGSFNATSEMKATFNPIYVECPKCRRIMAKKGIIRIDG